MSVETWVSIASSFLLAVVAIWGEAIRKRLMPPRLKLEVKTSLPDCVPIPASFQPNSTSKCISFTDHFLRVRVTNRGSEAKHVEVYAHALKRQAGQGQYRVVEDFLPMNLQWAHTGQTILPAIPEGVTRFLDIAHIIEPSARVQIPYEDKKWNGVDPNCAIISFIVPHKVNSRSYLQPPGSYRLHVLITAENAKTTARCVEIRITGKWFADADPMYVDGVDIRVAHASRHRSQDIFDEARHLFHFLVGQSQ